ncbi:hypothetical protein HA466_0167470 [Hirschfeldia incana]|nr:hypothetical protein HA466_0167470 [Hirschfeldia incana]
MSFVFNPMNSVAHDEVLNVLFRSVRRCVQYKYASISLLEQHISGQKYLLKTAYLLPRIVKRGGELMKVEMIILDAKTLQVTVTQATVNAHYCVNIFKNLFNAGSMYSISRF